MKSDREFENKKYNNLTDKLCSAHLFESLKGKDISAAEVAAELDIILQDFFSGSSELNQEKLILRFLNGNKFKLTIEKI